LFGLDAAGAGISQPFGKMGNYLPLNALCRTIDIDEREPLDDTDSCCAETGKLSFDRICAIA